MQVVLPSFFLLSYAAEQRVFCNKGNAVTSTVGIQTVDQFSLPD